MTPIGQRLFSTVKSNRGLSAVLVAVLLLLATQSVFVVDRDEFGIILTLGSPSSRPPAGPGRHFKIPFLQSIHRVRAEAATTYENSLVLTPLYPAYLSNSPEKFQAEAAELKRRLGSGKHILLGFAAFVNILYPAVGLDQALSSSQLARNFDEIDEIVARARNNGLVAHISLTSGFFHVWNDLRASAVRQDVRNAQWFADGYIAPPADLKDPAVVPRSVWITPSRYARPLRARVEEGARIIASHLAKRMAEFPETLVSVAGDGEVELSYERNFLTAAEKRSGLKKVLYTDYSPFAIAEFRDKLRAKYPGDSRPDADDDGDGRTFNRDYGQDFRSWNLKYFDDSGPLPLADYVALTEKLPASGRFFKDGGFDAPRVEAAGQFWDAWIAFRQEMIRNWVRDFAMWMTTSPAPNGFTIPAARYFSYQIPANLLFGGKDTVRIQTSASPLDTAFIDPIGSPGVTAFNVYKGFWGHSKTATSKLFSALSIAGDHWGILEYNPSVPPDDSSAPSANDNYYIHQLRNLYAYRPHVVAPFAWTDAPELRRYSIKGSSFERGLRRLVQDVGDTPWFSWRQTLRN